jgi:hypothetical protein
MSKEHDIKPRAHGNVTFYNVELGMIDTYLDDAGSKVCVCIIQVSRRM